MNITSTIIATPEAVMSRGKQRQVREKKSEVMTEPEAGTRFKSAHEIAKKQFQQFQEQMRIENKYARASQDFAKLMEKDQSDHQINENLES